MTTPVGTLNLAAVPVPSFPPIVPAPARTDKIYVLRVILTIR
jgi:hypothetical protein